MERDCVDRCVDCCVDECTDECMVILALFRVLIHTENGQGGSGLAHFLAHTRACIHSSTLYKTMVNAGEQDDILAQLSIHLNGWGPTAIPVGFEQIPYTPFSKSDRIGKIADWAAPTEEQGSTEHLLGKDVNLKSRRRFGASSEAFGTGLVSAFSYQVSAEDEANFSVVDRAAAPKKSSAFKGPTKGVQSTWARGAAAGQGTNKQAYGNKRFVGRGGVSDKNVRVRDPSIKVGPEWVLVEEMDFVRLNKLYFEVAEPKDL